MYHNAARVSYLSFRCTWHVGRMPYPSSFGAAPWCLRCLTNRHPSMVTNARRFAHPATISTTGVSRWKQRSNQYFRQIILLNLVRIYIEQKHAGNECVGKVLVTVVGPLSYPLFHYRVYVTRTSGSVPLSKSDYNSRQCFVLLPHRHKQATPWRCILRDQNAYKKYQVGN